MPSELAFQVNNDRQHHTIQLEKLKVQTCFQNKS